VWADEDSEEDLFQAGACCHEESRPEAAACHSGGSGGRPRGSSPARTSAPQTAPPAQWKPDARAPEFIPTTSMDCVMVGAASAGVQGRTPPLFVLGVAPAEEVALLVARACGVGVQPSAGQAPAGGATAAASAPPRRHGAKKGRPEQICTTLADLDSQGPTSGRGCDKGPHDEPEATEETWEHRAQQRARAVEIGRQSKKYQLCCETRKGCGSGGVDEPKTPDPHDRNVSKRMWKFLLREWNNALAERECRYLQQDPGSVVSTEEWQSVGAAPTEEPESVAAICGDSDSESTSDI